MRRISVVRSPKKLISIAALFALVLFTGKIAALEKGTEAPSEDRKIIAYYFHGTYRCSSCTKIEEWSYEAIRNSFPEALEEGKLLWKPVNVEKPENKHFAKEYNLYTKSLIIVEMDGKKQIRWKNLTKVWERLRNQQKFFSYVTQEVRDYLENL